MRKHTEWITAAEFSPDGVLLATGDRNNGLIVWEANTGREFFDLRGHQAAITDVSWRLDSNVVASVERGRHRQALGDGKRRQHQVDSAPTAAERPRFGSPRTGGSLTTGRDRVVRLWDQNGGKLREFEPFGDLALEAIFTPRRVAGYRRRLDGRNSGLGSRKTGAGWPISLSTLPHRRSS